MPLLASLLGITILGSTVEEFVGSVVSGVCGNQTDSGVRKLGTLLGDRLRRGKLARNHNLQVALTQSLAETFHIFGQACREDCNYEAARKRWIDQVIKILTDKQRLDAALRDAVPIEDGRDPAPDLAARLGAPSLSPEFVQPAFERAVGEAMAEVDGREHPSRHHAWLRAMAAGTWQARRTDNVVVDNVTLAEVFAFCFREKIKAGGAVKNLLTIDRLAALGEEVGEIKALLTGLTAAQVAQADAAVGAVLQPRFDEAIGEKVLARITANHAVLTELLRGIDARITAEADRVIAEGKAAAKAEADRVIDAVGRSRLGLVAPTDFPVRFVGREAELATVVEVVMTATPRIAVLVGEPGMGKSAIAHEVWRHPRVRERFEDRRWFIRCDELSNRSELETALASQLHLEVAQDQRWHSIAAALNEAPGVLILDNLEDFLAGSPAEAAELLAELQTLGRLGVVVTIRGGSWESGLGRAVEVAVRPLNLAVLRELFFAIRSRTFTGGTEGEDPWSNDPVLDELLAEADGSPDVTSVWARLSNQCVGDPVRPSREVPVYPTPDALSEAWRAQGLALSQADSRYLSEGSLARRRGLDASYALSLASPLHTEDSKLLLSLLGVLPAGMDETAIGNWVDQVVEACGVVVKDLGLAFFEDGRLRTRAPIRQFIVRTWPLTEEVWAAVENHYLTMAETKGRKVGRVGGAAAASHIAREWANLAVVLPRMQRRDVARTVAAVCGLAEFTRFTGLGDTTWLLVAAEATQAKDRANCVKSLGDIALARSDHEGARKAYEEARPMYEEVGDKLGEANCVKRLGDIALRRSDHEGARKAYEEARPMYEEVGDKLGEANCVKRLGDIALRRSDHEGARKAYEEARPMYEEVGDKLGEANCVWSLGDIALRRSDREGARERGSAMGKH